MKADDWLLATPEENSLEEEKEEKMVHRREDKEQIKLREKRDARTVAENTEHLGDRVRSSCSRSSFWYSVHLESVLSNCG